MTLRRLLVAMLALTGCWKLDPTAMPEGEIAYTPEIGGPEGWVVTAYDMPAGLECPDRAAPEFYVVHPETSAGPMPIAVVLHSGAFDYVAEPDPNDPLAGKAFQDPIRLTRDWALRRAFTTLGMYPNDDRFERHEGTLGVALAEQGVAMLLVPNCWGDMWHNRPGEADNAIIADGFERSGRTSAELGWRLATEPALWLTYSLGDPPVQIDADKAYMVGLGDGSRGVGELLTLGYTPAGMLVDSPNDDLRTYYADPSLYGSQIAGLDRIFPGGESTLTQGALGWADYPPRSSLVYSSLDSQIPANVNQRLLNQLGSESGAWVYDAAEARHVISNADLTIARQAVAWMLDTDPVTGDAGDTGS